MINTPNYNLNIPENSDQYNEEYYNTNFEIIDTELKRIEDLEEDQDEANR